MDIALVTEGISEYRVIKHFLNKYLKDEDVDVNQIQPEIANDKQISSGGWNEVLKFCASADKIHEALRYNTLLVIQIDTDLCQTAPFSVGQSVNGGRKSAEQLYDDIKERLIKEIPEDVYEKYMNKIVFAISSHMTECWLLVYYGRTEAQRKKEDNCFNILNGELARRNLDVIPQEKNSPNGVKAYNGLLKPIKKNHIVDASKVHIGLQKLLSDLDNADRNPITEDDTSADAEKEAEPPVI